MINIEGYEDQQSTSEVQDQPEEKPIGAIDYLSCVETDIRKPWETFNPNTTLRNAKEFLDGVIVPLGYEAGIHVQAGILNPPSVVLDTARQMDIKAFAGDIAYLKSPGETLKDITESGNPIESAGYAAMQYLPNWYLHERSITTMVNGILPVGDVKILRACTEIIANGQIYPILKKIGALEENIVLALEINGKYNSPSEYLALMAKLSDLGLPVGISFDTASMSSEGFGHNSRVDLAAAKRWFDKILADPWLLRILYCLEINPISESGERHASLFDYDTPYGMISKWRKSQLAHNRPHFVIETHPAQLKDFLRSPEVTMHTLRNL